MFPYRYANTIDNANTKGENCWKKYLKRWCGAGPEQNEGLALVEELGCVFHSTREGRVCGHRFGLVKLAVGRGRYSGYFSFLSDVCTSKVTTPGLVGDVR